VPAAGIGAGAVAGIGLFVLARSARRRRAGQSPTERSEWIHYAALAIKTQTPLPVLRDTVAQFPTFNEAYIKAIEKLEPV